jgi:dienelactone hydrolase
MLKATTRKIWLYKRPGVPVLTLKQSADSGEWCFVPNLFAATFLMTVLLIGSPSSAAESSGRIVELETPLARSPPLQGYLRQPGGRGPSPAVVLLHDCAGNWRRLDETWGKPIASWGYVTLTVDSFGPRGIKNTCGGGAGRLAFDAYRALGFLVKQPFVDPDRVAVLGFSQGARLALASVEHGSLEQTSASKFHAAIAFYPPCRTFRGNMTVPTLILIGELDDWTPAEECRNMVEGRDDWGVSRQKGEGIPARLIVFPGAYHAFDSPALRTPIQYFGHHLEFNQEAADRAAEALRDFLAATIGGKQQEPAK